MIRFACISCAARLQAPAGLASGQTRCPRCKTLQVVPAHSLVSTVAQAVKEEPATFSPSTNQADQATLDHLAGPSPLNVPVAPTNAPANGIGQGTAIPGYEILSELGRGGMGVVYKARQSKLNRLVAVKMILAGGHAGEVERARFQTEAEAIARLQHSNIVQLYEIGEHEGKPFFSLEFCGGGSLDRKLGGTPLPAREAAALVETLARAMQAAHDQNIIHRDLKPANVLLTEDGTPKITDFGLAKKMDEAGQTQSGSIMGTPSYMAPEQAAGKGKEIGPLADQYTLGAILYECLTGRPPFKAATVMDTIVQVVRDEPVPPSQLQSKTPRDLETICLKCLHKEARKRYSSAQALADDLERFLAGEPIRARAVGRTERAVKWVKRNPVVAALLALVVLSVVAGMSGILVKYLDAKEQERIASRKTKETEGALMERDLALGQAREDAIAAGKAKTLAEKREQEVLYQLATSNVLLAQAAWDSNNAAAARERLAAVPPELRNWEWHYLNRLYQGGLFALSGHTEIVMAVAFSPDGTRLATAGQDLTVRLWDARTGKELMVVCKGDDWAVWCLAFSPDGTQLATGGTDHTARVWDLRTGKELLKCEGHTSELNSLAFSLDGTRLATASVVETRVWDARTGEKLLEIGDKVFSKFRCVAFSPDSARLATVGDIVQLWDARTGKELLKCVINKGDLIRAAFSPDCTRLATASADQTVRLWDTATGKELLKFEGHTDLVLGLSFSPDGTRLATASDDHTARVWDARTGKELLVCKGHTASLNGVSFSPDGIRLATASGDKTAQVWDARTGRQLLACKGHNNGEGVNSLAFNPDGTRLATGGGWVRLWDARTALELQKYQGPKGVQCVIISPDGMRLATGNYEKTARLWDVRTGKELFQFKGSTYCRCVAFSPDGTRLANAGQGGTLVWDTRTGQQLVVCEVGEEAYTTSVAFSPDGTRLATAESMKQSARVWDARTGKQLVVCSVRALGEGATIYTVAFSPDGKQLATSCNDGARLWNAETGEQLLVCKGHNNRVNGVAFSLDGTRLATAGQDGTARLWDTRTGQQLLVLKGHTKSVKCLAFSADGCWLATGSEDGTARLWDARPLPSPASEELEYRLRATQPDLTWHEEQFKNYLSTDHRAAAFHLNQLLAYTPPPQRNRWLGERATLLEATLMQDEKDSVARLLLARTAWHSPNLILAIKDLNLLIPAMDDKRPFAQRTRAALLLRLAKAAEAAAVLEPALKERGDDKPPVEELLLAWAYLDTNQVDKAKQLWNQANSWLDREEEAVRAANLLGTLPNGVLPGMVPLFAPSSDPRYNAIDWETWHELAVLRHDLGPRFADKKH